MCVYLQRRPGIGVAEQILDGFWIVGLRRAAVKAEVLAKDERVRFGFHNLRHSLASTLVRLKTDLTYFGEPAYEYDIAQAIEDGYLAACEIQKGRVNLDTTGITKEDIIARHRDRVAVFAFAEEIDVWLRSTPVQPKPDLILTTRMGQSRKRSLRDQCA